MGWDYVDYGERYIHLRDIEIWALRHFLADAAHRLAAESPGVLMAEAEQFFLSWEWPGPGVVMGTKLDRFVRGEPERNCVLVRICDLAIARLREFGEVVPLAYLAAHINADSPGGEYSGEPPTVRFIRGVEGIRGLLNPDSERGSVSDPAV